MEKISVKQCADLLGVSPQTVRERMKRKIWDIGIVSKSRQGIRRYDIFKSKVERLIGKEQG